MHHVECMAALNPTWFRAQMNADFQDRKEYFTAEDAEVAEKKKKSKGKGQKAKIGNYFPSSGVLFSFLPFDF